MPSTAHLLGLSDLGLSGLGLKCEQEVERRYEIVPSVVCSMCCLFGIIYCFFAERGGVWGIGLGIGTLCGLVTMLVRSVGCSWWACCWGCCWGVASLVAMEEFYHPRTVWVPIGVLLGSGTLFAVLTLQWQRCFVTLSTATFGSAIITVTVDYFIELFALVHYIYERLRVSPKKPQCWFTWVILGCGLCWLYSECSSMVLSRQQRRVQLMKLRQREERVRQENEKKKKKKKQRSQASSRSTITQAPPTHSRATPPATQSPPPQTEPGYHRKPHPKRRFDGDVLSPSYIRSFRDRQSDRRSYSHTRISRSRMSQLDYDCGSQTPLTAPSGPPARI
ncbi:hypothetical protein WMY93_002173 [Mugilogobius chulae]|uniref:Transmembrane protein 198 n=1 Tax=Mugilogobius chulae TaxID=88201 RepID=A0AAW0Q3R5_9GOBI